jgi:plastocyanin
MKRIRRSRLLGVVAAVTLAATLVSCGDDDDSAEPAAPAAAQVAASEGEVIEVEMVDYEFIGVPETAEVGSRITVVNNSQTEMHEVVALRLPDGEDRSLEELLQLPEDELDALLPEMPDMVLLAAPGGPQIDAVGDGTFTMPGRYVLVCGIPAGVDPEEFLAAAAENDGPPDVAGGPPHFALGMVAEITIE